MNLGIFRTVGIVLFLYLTWRKLREDYPENELVAYGWVAILSFLVGSRLAFGLINWGVWNERWWDWLLFWEKPGSSLVWGYWSILLASWWWGTLKKWKVWSFFEEITSSLMLMMALVAFDEAIRSWANWQSWALVGVFMVGVGLAKLLTGKYRSYVWYRSGKKGFIFLAVNAVVWFAWFGIMGNYLRLVVGLIYLGGLVMLGDVLEVLKINLRRSKK